MKAELKAEGRTFELTVPEDFLGTHLAKGAWYEPDLLESIQRNTKPGQWAIDVGAHVGNHTVWMAGVCGLRVMAFEPCRPSADLLLDNVMMNGLGSQVEVFRAALGAKTGSCRCMSLDPANTGTAIFAPDEAGDTLMMQLDEALDMLPTMSLMKVDVEGAQMAVLRGAAGLLGRDHPILYVEAATEAERKQVERFLRKLGYEQFGVFAKTPTYGYRRQG